MIDLQLLTGARPGEVAAMRAVDIDTSRDDVWVFRPPQHKNAHRGGVRSIYIGPKGQDIIGDFLTDRPVDAYLFSPCDASREHHAARGEKRKTPLSCGNKVGTNRQKSPRVYSDTYARSAYRQAVVRACDRAGIARWSPGQLRHNAATRLRKQHGLEVAQVMLGHAAADITQLYAERDEANALVVAARAG